MSKRSLQKNKTLFITRAAIIAALYVIFTLLSGAFGLDGKGIIQIRISEALCVLPVFTSAAVPGVTVGCLIYNLIFCSPIDAVFGTLATLIGVLCTHYIPVFKKHLFIAGLPTVISNTAIIPFLTVFVYSNGALSSLPLFALAVFVGEFIACIILGTLLALSLKKHISILF